MEQEESKEEILHRTRMQHAVLDRRLRMLLGKPYLTVKEEVEIRNLKKQKLYVKDIMEYLNEEIKKGELH